MLPLIAGQITRFALVKTYGQEHFQKHIGPKFPRFSTLGVLGIVFVAMAHSCVITYSLSLYNPSAVCGLVREIIDSFFSLNAMKTISTGDKMNQSNLTESMHRPNTIWLTALKTKLLLLSISGASLTKN